jgi:Coenzyme PQQ synthesis protein D (PqqD)
MSVAQATRAASAARCRANVVSHLGRDAAVVVRAGDSAKPRSVFLLNESAAKLWELVRKGASGCDLARCLQDEYGIPAKQAEQDSDEFLSSLVEAGLIERY